MLSNPICEHFLPATSVPNLTDSSTDFPEYIFHMAAPMKQSPAPRVSIALTERASTKKGVSLFDGSIAKTP